MKEFVPEVYATEYVHERNIIRLCYSKVIRKSNILDMIETYLKEYPLGITMYNNPYTTEYDFSSSPQYERLYKYDHGHPFSIVIRLLCEGDIMIIDEALMQIVKQISETRNKDIADFGNIIRYFHSDAQAIKHIHYDTTLYEILQILTNIYINLRSIEIHNIQCQKCKRILRKQDGRFMHFVNQNDLERCISLQHFLSIQHSKCVQDVMCEKCNSRCVYNHLSFNDSHLFIIEFRKYPKPPRFNTSMNAQLKVPIVSINEDKKHINRITTYFLKYIIVINYDDFLSPYVCIGDYELIMLKYDKWFYFANRENDDGELVMKIFEMSLDEIISTRFYVTHLIYVKQESIDSMSVR